MDRFGAWSWKVVMHRLLALVGVAGLAGSAGAAAAATLPERAELEARVAEARRHLAEPTSAAPGREAATGTLTSEGGAWNNWPNWSNWANWANG
jgi:hypothetical protein